MHSKTIVKTMITINKFERGNPNPIVITSLQFARNVVIHNKQEVAIHILVFDLITVGLKYSMTKLPCSTLEDTLQAIFTNRNLR